MSAIPRSRSLRKPSTTVSSEQTSQEPPNRPNASPSRLPVKPSGSQRADSSTTLRSGRVVTGSVDRRPSVRQRPPAAGLDSGRKDASHYPPSTAVTRPVAPRRPSSAEGDASQQRKRVPTHSRAKSTVTASSTSTVLRPPSQTQPRANAAGTRPLHTKKPSVDKPATSISAQTQPRLRPAFTTLQQHFSPAKSLAPKPLTSTILAPPSPSKLPVNVAASAETSRLQGELLQLHLLDRDAAEVEAQWHASAKEKLGERFEKLARASNALAEEERSRLEDENLLALRRWSSSRDLEEKVQRLDAVVKGVWSLSEAGGRYSRVVRRFERWVDGVCAVEEARKKGFSGSQSVDDLFISELDPSWKEECAGITRRLDGWRRQLRDMEPIPADEDTQGSSVTRMMGGVRSLIHDMLEELSLMEDIEREAWAKEDDWIKRMSVDDSSDDTPGAGAIWRGV